MSRKRRLVGGGAKPFEKYILLSCPEFNDVVDKMIAEDASKCYGTCPGDYKTGVKLHNKLYPKDNAEDILRIMNKHDNDIKSTMTGGDKRILFSTFAIDDAGKDLDEGEIAAKKDDIRKNFLRAENDFESNTFYRGYINWKTYNDETPDIKMGGKTTNKLKGAKIIYLAYFSFNEKGATPMMNQLLFLNSLNHYGVAEINIVLPYFPVGTLERIVGEGEIPTAYALAHMLNSIPSGAAKNNIYIFDIHALCSRFFFHSNTRPVLISMMEEYMNYINNDKYSGAENLNVIVFPDDGAKKRFEKLLPKGTKKIVCAKVRDGDKRLIKIESGFEKTLESASDANITSVNFFVVDDLVQSGGTVLETLDGIKKELSGVSYKDKIKFIPMITHSVFPKDDNIKDFFSRKAPKVDEIKIAKPTSLNNVNRLSTERASYKMTPALPPFDMNSLAKVDALITTNSRPLRVKEIDTHLKELNRPVKPELLVIDISKTLTRVFNNEEGTTITGNRSFHDQ